GMPTTHGCLPLKDHVAAEDSVQVRRLRAAGAVVVGKTNTPEFGYTAITKNLLFGVTRSPWDPERTPGGSSGGSAAAVAGRMLPLVTASDGGGSIRLPAAFSGCFGLKTSFGRIPHGPSTSWEYVETAVYGPLTKTVEDAAFFLDVTAGPAPEDPRSLPPPGLSYREALREPLPRLRIAYARDFGYVPVQRDVAEAVEEAVGVFRALGHQVFEVADGPEPAGAAWAMTGNFDIAGRWHEVITRHGEDLPRSYVQGLRAAWEMTPERWGELARARMRVARWSAELFQRVDLLITPTTPFEAPPAKGPFPVEIDGRRLPPAGVAAFTIPFNLTWQPAASVRVGLSRAGLPIGMQIVGPWHRDDLVLRAAAAFQRERPWHPRWPEVP
ncbi:MAG TPA: amidase, partial [Dehalococcoidia bacterium]